MKNSLLQFVLSSLMSLTALVAYTQEPIYNWAATAGGTGSDIGNCITADPQGNVYITGGFSDTADFDPGSGVTNLISNGGSDISIYKLSPSGGLIWARSIGGNFGDQGFGIHYDTAGYIYVIGNYRGTADFDPGPGVANLSAAGNADPFVLKLDTAGNYIWAKSIGGPSLDYGLAITSNHSDHVYISGSFQGTADFDPGPGVNNLVSNGNLDGFVAKLDSAGNFLWARSMGSTNGDQCLDIDIDPLENVYLTGYFADTVDFDPGPGITNLVGTGVRESFVWKLNSAGNLGWAISVGSMGWDQGYGISAQTPGFVYIGGIFAATTDFDPGPGVANITSAGSTDIYIHKLDTGGNFVWAKANSSVDGNFSQDVNSDAQGNVYICGTIFGTVDFDPGPGSFQVSPAGGNDSYLQKLDSAGNFVWVKTISGPASEFSKSIALTPSGDVYTTGSFSDTSDFHPGSNTVLIASQGMGDAFVLKLSPCSDSTYNLADSACGFYYFNGNILQSSGVYTDTFTSVGGCDSILILDLTIFSPSGTIINDTACDIYFFGGAILTQSGNYLDTLTNSNGCDSIVALNLTLSTSTFDLVNDTGCNEYFFDGQFITDPGIYFGNFTNIFGCDSLVSLTLTMNYVDTSVSQMGATLVSNDTVATYQWLGCDLEYFAFSGADSQAFTPAVNGNYAVEVSNGSCVDTSGCHAVVNVGGDESFRQLPINLYPNPTHGQIALDLGEVKEEVIITISNLIGQSVFSSIYNSVQLLELEIPGPSGVYFVEVESPNGTASIVKVIKQ